MYDTKYFDREFFEGRTGAKGGQRGKESPDSQAGVLFGVAIIIHKFFQGLKMLEIGGGIGRITYHLQDLGDDVQLSEVSQWAVDNTLASPGTARQGDIRNLEKEPDNSCEIVICWNVLAYLEKKDVARAIAELKRVTEDYVLLSISTAEKLEIHPEAKIKRLTIKPRRWWVKQLKKAKLKEDIALTAQINNEAGWNNIFVFRK